MICKEIIGILLVSGTLQVFATDKQGKNSEINNDDFPKKGLNYFQSYKKGFREASDVAALQFQKDYKTWEKKNKNRERYFKKADDNSNHLKFNEISSEEHDEKFKKDGDSFNPNFLNNKKEKSYHKKRALEKEEQEKQGSLLHDTDVNYINNNKEVSGDSEVISNTRSLLNDTDVNNIKDNTEAPENTKITSNKPANSREKYQENYQNGNELYMKRIKKDFYQTLIKIDLTSPPPANDTILMARYIVHNVDWAALGTLSGRSPTKGSPFVCVKATSDGVKNVSSGIPFFYMSSMDLCTQDLEKDNRVSVLVTLSETEYCKEENLDPQDPRCAKLTLSGKIKKIKSGSEEEKFAKTALFTRHPAMVSWPTDHNFYFTKLKIGQIILLDQFGGATYIKVKDYLNGKVLEPELKKK